MSVPDLDENALANFDPDEFEAEMERETVPTSHLPMAVFGDFLLRSEILRAVADCGFEHPSAVQCRALPLALMGSDVICQAQSGMGKTAVFVLSVLQQIDPEEPHVQCVVLCHTRELAYQISSEFNRFAKHLPGVRSAVFFGGVPVRLNRQLLASEHPQIVVGTPGRMKQLVREEAMDLSHVRTFVMDEADKLLEQVGLSELMRNNNLKTCEGTCRRSFSRPRTPSR